MPSPALIEKIARCYVAVTIIVYLVDLWRQTRDGLTDGAGRPFGDDFINFWSGPYLAWHQRAAEIYNFEAFHAFEQSIVGLHLQGYNYSYPPVLLVLTAPLALVPYIPGLRTLDFGGMVCVLPRAAAGDAERPHAAPRLGDAGGIYQYGCRAERHLDRGAVRRRPWLARAMADLGRRFARAAGLQAAAWNFDSHCAVGRAAMACAGGRERGRRGSRRHQLALAWPRYLCRLSAAAGIDQAF